MSVIVDYGYLGTAYLSEAPYLGSLVDNQLSAQIEMRIKDNPDENNIQVNMRINDTDTINTQIESRIENFENIVNAQIDQKIFKANSIRTQTEMRIFTEDNLNFQIEQKIFDVEDIGTQIDQKIFDENVIRTQSEMQIFSEDNLNSQIEQRIFDDVNIGVQIDQKIDPDIDPIVLSQVEMRVENLNNNVNTQTTLTIADEQTLPVQIQNRIENFANNISTQIEQRIEDYANVLSTQVKRGGLGHYICGGYLEADYLSEPYLAYRLCAVVPMQVVFSTNADNEINTQSEMKIDRTDDDPILNTQVERRIENYENNFNVQIDRRILDNPENILTQIEQKIFADEAVKTQIEQKIFNDNNINTQVNRLRAIKLGAQINLVIYNITQLRFLCEFISRGTEALGGNNWTSVQAVDPGDFSPNNLNTDIVEQRTQTSSIALWQLRCDTGNANSFVDTVGILEHNFSRGAVVQVQASDDPAFGSIKFNFNMTVETTNMYYIAPELPKIPARYYQFTIQDPGNTDGKLYIGTIVFGSSQILTVQDQFVNPVSYGFRHFKDTLETEGYTSQSNDRALRKFLNLSFEKLDRSGGNFKSLRDYILTAKTDLKCLVIPRPTLPSTLAVFAKLTQLPEEQHTANADNNWYVDLTLDWDESL